MTTTEQRIAYATRLPTACSWVSRGMLLRMLRSMLIHVLGLAFVIRHGDVNPGHQGLARASSQGTSGRIAIPGWILY